MNYSYALLFLTFFCNIIVYSSHVPGRCPVVSLPNGRVRARSRGRIIRFTCSDGFVLVGDKYSTCIRGRWDTPTPVCVNSACPTPTTPEHALMAEVFNGAILMYFCEPGYALIGPSEIYCNGRQWNGTTPYCRDTNAVAPTKCDFETPDLCWWEQDPTHDFDWRRHNFETPTSHVGTGPTHDHTLGRGNDGYYLYVEASGRLENDTARIISPLYNASLTDSGCFSFWYHMYGATMGGLRIYFKTEFDTKLMLMFKRDGNQGNMWIHGQFDLPRTNKSFQIAIEGVRGASYVSDIAIDDVAILQGDECKMNKTESDMATVPPNDDDQIELVNAMQTCRGRCSENTTESLNTSAPSSLPETCQCTIDCAETSTCCPDYAEYCVLSVTDGKTNGDGSDMTSVTVWTTGTYVGTTAARTYKPRQTSTTHALGRNISEGGILINEKDDIDPITAVSGDTGSQKPNLNVTRRPTTVRHEALSTILPDIRTKAAARTTRRPIITTRKSTPSTTRYWRLVTENSTVAQRSTTKVTSKKIAPHSTSTIASTTAVHENRNTDPHMMTAEETPTIQRNTGGTGLSGIVSAVIGILVCTVIVTTVAFVLIRRRKTYTKRGVNGTALSEDSDVRFLTSDEILDFSLARPNENDE